MAFSVTPNPDVDFEIVHADADFLVVNKPSGVATQPGKKHEHDSLLNGLFYDFGNALQNLGEERNWGQLHRLDKDTSGLLLVALRIKAYEHLSEQFKTRQVKKIYFALVQGIPRPAQGVIQQPIAEVIGARKKAVIRRDGKQAVTAYRTIETVGGIALVEARPTTGRLHQVRVHLASMGCPIVGESVYAPAGNPPMALCLHASEVSFIHPASGHRVSFHAPIPSGFAATAKHLGIDVKKCVRD
jgi:23S rRNA pseudouridine1911/1915/1917 synthase